jgi:hypothetical protein
MALDTDVLKTEIAEDLKEFGEYSTDAGGYLERQLTAAGKWLFKAFPWDFTLKQANLATVSGTLGPYSLASFTDFDELAPERRLSKYYAYDAADIDAPIQDGDNGWRYEITLNRSTGVPVLNFRADPGTGTRVFTYRKLFSFADMSNWPDKEEFKTILRSYTAYMVTRNTPDWADAASNYLAQAKEDLKDLKFQTRQGMIRQDSRDPQDVYGNSLYQGFTGDFE